MWRGLAFTASGVAQAAAEAGDRPLAGDPSERGGAAC
jgi:hypothetical protein